MRIVYAYPKTKSRELTIARLRRALVCVFIIAFIACATVNLATGGRAWCLLVAGGELTLWSVAIHSPLFESTLMRRIYSIVLSCCCYLILIDALYGNGWSTNVVAIICFSLLIILSLIFFIGFSRQRRNVMPLFWLILGSLVAIICALAGLAEASWEMIVLGSVSGALIIVSIILYRYQIFNELKKRFHV